MLMISDYSKHNSTYKKISSSTKAITNSLLQPTKAGQRKDMVSRTLIAIEPGLCHGDALVSQADEGALV